VYQIAANQENVGALGDRSKELLQYTVLGSLEVMVGDGGAANDVFHAMKTLAPIAN